MNAVGAIDISPPGRSEHGGVALGLPTETMRGGLARIVGFGFDDAAADPIDEQADTDQIARDIECIAAKEIAIELGAPARQAISDWRQ